jgi:hypothetical protein
MIGKEEAAVELCDHQTSSVAGILIYLAAGVVLHGCGTPHNLHAGSNEMGMKRQR